MEWQIILFILGVLLTMVGTMAIFILNKINCSIENAIESINKLNIEVAEVIKEIKYHDTRLTKLEEKI